jgi:RNA polymerase sigma-70 factor, ECF subfamily
MHRRQTHHESERDREWSQWMAAAQDGDRIAYERLLRDIVPFIRAVIARQNRRPDRLEDVVQDVLLTLHRVRHTYDPARPFSHWLAALAQRRSIDALRRRSRVDAAEVRDASAYETFADPAANKDFERSSQADALRTAIAGLPEGQKEAVRLLKLQEMTLNEASRASGKSIAALKVNVHRALRALRARMRRE